MAQRRIVGVLCAVIATSATAGAAMAQAVGDGVALPDYEGVELDPSGRLTSRESVDDKAIAALRRRALAANPERERVVISLPKLLAEAAALGAKGQPLPDEIRYLRGLVRIEGLEVDEAAGDLRLTGFAEPIEKTAGHRALGATSGRPIVQFDDLVVALRLFGPGRWDQAAGCTIQLTAEGAARFVDEFNRLSTKIINSRPGQRHDVAALLAKAAGDQNVKFIGQSGDTRFARVCIDADYQMKRLAMGLDKPPIPMPSYVSMVHRPDTIVDRFWFEQAHEPVVASDDGRTILIRGPALAVRTRKHGADANPDVISPAAERFAQLMTAKMDTLARFTPAFGDLANLSDLALAAAIIGHDRLDKRIRFDLAAAIDPAKIAVAKMTVPTAVPMLANWNEHDRNLIFTGGGVRLDYSEAFGGREDAGDPQKKD